MAQEELKRQGKSIVRSMPKEPRKYDVIILNDDFTTFEFVIMVMMTVFLKSQQEACSIAETTHVRQSAKVGTYSLDIAESKVARATSMAREEGYPLQFRIDKQED